MADNEDQEPGWFTKFSETINTKLDILNSRLDHVDSKLVEFQNVKKIVDENRSMILENRSMIQEIQKELKSLKQRVIYSDAQSKRNNLIFDGIAENHTNETWIDCQNKLCEILEKDLGITAVKNIRFERVHRKGPYKPDNIPGVIAKFTFYQDREMVWKKHFSLKGSNIWISEDYPPEIQNARKRLYSIMRAAQNEARKSGIARKVSLSLDKLVLDGKVFTINDLDNLPANLRPENISTKTTGNVTVFYTRNSILSNFHMNTPFRADGELYNCTEQFIQHAKAKLFNDDETAYKILRAKTSHEQCQLGKKVKGYDEHKWMNAANDILLKANLAKFDQNEHARKVLLQTGPNVLGEASKNKKWGIGLSLDDPNVTNTQHWDGRNLFGKVLENVRSQMRLKYNN